MASSQEKSFARSAFDVLFGRAPAPGTGTGRLASTAKPKPKEAKAKRSTDERAEAAAASSPQSPSPLPLLKPKRTKQMIMVLGQRNVRMECAQCGMVYVPSLKQDAEAHKRFCAGAGGAGLGVAFKVGDGWMGSLKEERETDDGDGRE